MITLDMIKFVRERTLELFNKLDKYPYKGIDFISHVIKEVDSRYCQGGMGDITSMEILGIDKSGWLIIISVEEAGPYKNGLLEQRIIRRLDDKETLDYLLSEKYDQSDRNIFISKNEDLKKIGQETN